MFIRSNDVYLLRLKSVFFPVVKIPRDTNTQNNFAQLAHKLVRHHHFGVSAVNSQFTRIVFGFSKPSEWEFAECDSVVVSFVLFAMRYKDFCDEFLFLLFTSTIWYSYCCKHPYASSMLYALGHLWEREEKRRWLEIISIVESLNCELSCNQHVE